MAQIGGWINTQGVILNQKTYKIIWFIFMTVTTIQVNFTDF